jgi:site-specific recombinase XerD
MEVDSDVPTVLGMWLRASPPNTVRAVANDLRQFSAYVSAHTRAGRPVPATTTTVLNFLTWMQREGYAVSTIRRATSSLGLIHRLSGVEDPTDTMAVTLRLHALARRDTRMVRQAEPLRFAAGDMSVEELLTLPARSLAHYRDRALISVAYDTALRSAELVQVQVQHVRPRTNAACELVIPRAKATTTPRIAVLSTPTLWHIRAWEDRAALAKVGDTNPLFRGVREEVVSSAALSKTQVGRIVKRCVYRACRARGNGAAAAHAFAARFSSHSLRVGLAQDHLADNIEIVEIAEALRVEASGLAMRYAGKLLATSNPAAVALQEMRNAHGC